jgi:hypothetical protein
MTLLYKRQVKIEIGADISTPFLTIYPDTLASRTTVERTMDPEPDSGVIEIYNLTRDQRKKLESKDLVVTVTAGYEGGLQGVVFRGTTRRTHSAQSNADWITTMEAFDGDYVMRDGAARMAESYGPSATTFNVIRNIAYSFVGVAGAQIRGFSIAANFDKVLLLATDLAKGDYAEELKTAFSTKFKRGLTLFAPSRELMTFFCDKHDLIWFFMNHVLTIVTASGDIGAPVAVLTPNNGLIGMPEKLEGGFIQCRTLLRPEIVLGSKVWIKDIGDISLEGTIRIEKISTVCETHGSSFTMTLTGEQLSS